MTTTYGFKAMNLDMTCRNFQFEVGKTYKINNNKPLELCSDRGFHFCLNFEDVFNYYNWEKARVFKVQTESGVVTGKDKSITKEITILGEVTKQDIDFKKLKTDFAKNFYKIFLEDNEEIIFNKFKNNKDWDIRVAVVNKLSDKKLLFETFKNDKDEDIRRAVIKKLSDEKSISYFKEDEDWGVRQAVVKQLSDEKLIYSFKDDEHWFVRKTVINKISDEKLIFDTFKDDEHWFVRQAVVEKLSDEKLISYFKEDEDEGIRFIVAERLNNK